MEALLAFSPHAYFNYFIIITRIAGLFLVAPVLSSARIPARVRILLAALMALMLFQVLPLYQFSLRMNVVDYFFIAGKELVVGMLLGTVARILFAAIEFAGTVIGFQMGLSIANVVDPQTSQQISIIASFENLVATLLFVVLDGHHIFFEALAVSYEKIPLAGMNFDPSKLDFFINLTADIFIIGMQIGSPIIVALLFANVIMGFMARAVPQMNIFVVGFPFTITMGLIFLLIGMPFYVKALGQLFSKMGQEMLELINIMAR